MPDAIGHETTEVITRYGGNEVGRGFGESSDVVIAFGVDAVSLHSLHWKYHITHPHLTDAALCVGA